MLKLNFKLMKNFFLLSLVFAGSLAFSSCKKCVECKGVDPAAGNGEVKKEYCGNKTERAAGELDFRSRGYTDVKCDD